MAANVNKPTDTKQKEVDVNRKLQLYGILTAFQNGKAPSNEQIDIALNSFLSSKALANPSNNLSAEGKALVRDAQDVVRQAKNLLLCKNEGNLLQEFIWETQKFDPKAVGTPNVPVSKDAAKSDGQDALQGLRTLGTLLITNGQFRKLLNDATVLFRDMAGDAASNAAQKVRPSDEQLNQMDHPADDNTWHDAPDFSKDNLKNQAQGFYKGNPKEDVKDAAAAGVNTAAPGNQGVQGQNQHFQSTNQQGLQNQNQQGVQSFQSPHGVQGFSGQGNVRESDPAAGKNAAKNVIKDRVDNNVDGETKDSILARNEEYSRRTREYLDKKMPQERKDQTIWRLKKMVLECQQHPDYAQAIETLLNLAEQYGRHGRHVGLQSADTTKQARGGFSGAEESLRTLIERFANGTSTEDLWDSIGQVYRDADNDRELKDWFKRMDNYIRRCLLQQGFILEDQSTEEWNQLYDHGKFLLRDKYRGHTDRVLDEIKFLAEEFDRDPQNKAFGQSCQKLFTDLGNDNDGKPVFKPHLVKDLTDVIIPAIMENVSYVPIPRIEYTDPQFDAIIENLVLESDNFMPNILEVSSDQYFRWGRKKIANKNHQTIEVKVAGVQMDLRDVSYHVKRKQGFPSITDTGVLDVLLPGDGFSFKMKVRSADKSDRQNYFKVEKVDVDVKTLNIKLKQSKHKLLFNLFKPIMLKVIRPPLQKAIEKAIKDKCNEVDALVFKVKQEADRAKDEAKSNPENAPNIYRRYYSAAQTKAMNGKQKTKEKTEDKKVNVAVTKQDSIFPNIHLPGGISSKATEYKELAQKGDRWESPVFSIGSAKRSTDIPSAPKIRRKPHETREPGHNLQGDFDTQGSGFQQGTSGYQTGGNNLQQQGNYQQQGNFQQQNLQQSGLQPGFQQGNALGQQQQQQQGLQQGFQQGHPLAQQQQGNFQQQQPLQQQGNSGLQGLSSSTYQSAPQTDGSYLPGNGHTNGHMNGNGLNKISV